MQLQDQVSLELAKKLKKLGVKQDSLWYWIKKRSFWVLVCLLEDKGEYTEKISAQTVAEGLNELPPFIIKDEKLWHLEITCGENEMQEKVWEVGYCLTSAAVEYLDIESDTSLADAISKTRICLIEKKLIESK